MIEYGLINHLDHLGKMSILLLADSPLKIYFPTHPPEQFWKEKMSQSKDIIFCYFIFASPPTPSPHLATNEHYNNAEVVPLVILSLLTDIAAGIRSHLGHKNKNT